MTGRSYKVGDRLFWASQVRHASDKYIEVLKIGRKWVYWGEVGLMNYPASGRFNAETGHEDNHGVGSPWGRVFDCVEDRDRLVATRAARSALADAFRSVAYRAPPPHATVEQVEDAARILGVFAEYDYQLRRRAKA
jgi:hypothetical protein